MYNFVSAAFVQCISLDHHQGTERLWSYLNGFAYDGNS